MPVYHSALAAWKIRDETLVGGMLKPVSTTCAALVLMVLPSASAERLPRN